MKRRPNKAPKLTILPVTPAVDAPVAPTTGAALTSGEMDKGFPVFLERAAREIISPVDNSKSKQAWHPANNQTKRLVRCVESLRDIDDILEDADAAKSETKRKRKFKHLFTPLLSLVESIVELLQSIESAAQGSTEMSPKDCQLVSKLRQRFLEHVPLSSDSLLKKIRHKISAHIDKDMWPSELTELFGKAEPSVVGKWLHVSLGVLMDVLKLQIYAWSVLPTPQGTITLMYTEPFVSTFRVEELKIVELLACNIAKKSPRQEILLLAQSIVAHSRWMFGESDFQIRSWIADSEKENWASTLRNIT